MTLSLAISIKVDPSGLATGGAEAKRQLDAIGVGAKGAEQNLKEMEAAAVRASRAARDTARDTAEAMRSKLAAERAVGMQTFTPNRAADVAAYGAAMDALRAKHSPLFAAQRQYKSQLDEIRQAEKVGALTSIEAAAAIGRSKTSFASQVGAINASRAALAGHAAQSKLTSEQSKQLSYQLHDVVVSLASGMNPMIVALQQGSQITPLFGGIGGTMRALVGMINPVTASIAALVVTTAGGAAAWNSYLKSTLEVQTALTGLGRNSGATRRELEAIAQANAAGGGMTVSQARSIETQLLRTGKVGVESFGSVIRITRDFAATLGTDAETAAQKLAEILADPAKGAADLQRQYGLLDGATARYVERLQLLGREEEARTLILDRLPQQLASHREALTGWARLWDDATRAVKGYVEAAGKAVENKVNGSGDPRIDRMRALEEEIRSRKDWLGAASPRQREALRIREEELARLKGEDAARESERKAEAERSRAENEAKNRADRAVGVSKASPINELAERRRQLKLEIEQLEKGAQGRFDLDPAEDAARRREVNAAIEGKRAALEGLRPAQERQAELDRIDAAIAMARDPVTKAQLSATREKIALEEQEMSVSGRAQAIENARMKVLLDASSSGRNRAADMRDEARARAAVNDAIAGGRVNVTEADRFMRTEQELRPLLIAYAKAEGAAKLELARIIEQLRQASAEQAREEARSGALQIIAGQKEKLETLRAEMALMGASETTRARMLALLEAEQQIRRGNISATSAEATQIRANAEAQAALTAQIERQKSAYSTLRQFGERQIDAIIDKIAEQGLSWKSMGDLGKSALTDLSKEMMRLAIGNPLKNALFGGNLPTMADAQGLFGMLGGKNGGSGVASIIAGVGARSVGGMTVNAASVVVNGGVGGVGASALSSILPESKNPLAGLPSLSDSGATSLLKSIAPSVGPNAISGLQPEFQRRLATMAADAQQLFGKNAFTINSGFRSVERQRELWDAALEKYGSAEIARKWVAPPGASQHNLGGAVDLQYGSPAAKAWMQENAGRYGLDYRLQNEDWHLEMAKGQSPITAFTRSTEAANDNLTKLATSTGQADLGLDKLGSSAEGLGRAMSSLGGGGGSGLSLGGLSLGGAKPNAAGVFFSGSSTGGLYHSGGMVGDGHLGRSVDWSVFGGAPRFHTGGLLSGERPVIAQVGEGIFTPRQMDNADALIRAAMQPRSLKLEAAALTRAPEIKAPAVSSSPTRVTVVNNGRPVSAEQRETQGPDGKRDITIILDEMQAANATNANAKTYQAIRRAHGTSPALAGRSR